MRKILLTLIACAVISWAKPVVTNETVEAMLRSGFPVPMILSAIKTAAYIQLVMSTEFYNRLLNAGASPGVADQIVTAMHDRTYNGAMRPDDIKPVPAAVAHVPPPVVPADAPADAPEEIARVAPAQQPEPESADVLFGLRGANLVPLERQPVGSQADAAGFLKVNGKGALTVPGAASPVRFQSGGLAFVVRSFSAMTAADPSDLYLLRKLTPNKDRREVIVRAAHTSPKGPVASNTHSDGVLPVRVSRYGASSYKVAVDDLPPGEYALGRAGDHEEFCFGVD